MVTLMLFFGGEGGWSCNHKIFFGRKIIKPIDIFLTLKEEWMRVRSNRTLILQSNQTLRRELHFLLNSYYLIKYMSITFLTIKVVKAIKPYIQTKCNYWITRAERTKQ